MCKAVNTKHRCAKGQILMNMQGVDVKDHAYEVQSFKLKYVWINIQNLVCNWKKIFQSS